MKDYTFKAKQGLVSLTMVLLVLGSSNPLFAKSTSEKIKSGIDASAETLKEGVDKTGEIAEKTETGVKKGIKKMGEKVEDMQTYFRQKFHEQATFHHATVSDVTFNGHHMATVVK